MTKGYFRVRLLTYAGIALQLSFPCWMLAELSSRSATNIDFVLCAIVLVPFLLIGRWDLVGYGLHYVFLAAFLLLAYHDGGWLPPLFCCVFLAVLWLSFRRIGASHVLELEFPLRGGTFYVAHGGSLRLLNYHRISSRSQRFALDIVKLRRWGTRAAGIYPRHLGAYGVFGEVVYSPCSGLVTSTVNDLPDLTPGEMDRENAAGNCVVICMDGSDVSVLLAHLSRGSVLVSPGDHVLAGQSLAKVGNSGNTSEPHLHIHAQRAVEGPTWEGLPMRFRGRWLVRNDLVRV
jgi:hypothetical protein